MKTLQGHSSAISMDGYFNSAKNPADWPWSLNRSTEDLVTLTPSHSQLACTYDLIEAITSTDPLRFEEFDRDLTSFALVKKQVNKLPSNEKKGTLRVTLMRAELLFKFSNEPKMGCVIGSPTYF